MLKPPQEFPTIPDIVVLDTNVVLDWLVFRNPDGLAIRVALESARLRWIGTAAMRLEVAHVLSRGDLGDRRPDLPALWATWDRHCVEVAEPLISAAPSSRLRCTDPDDQMFIDLAVACRARWLLSRDRAVLKLAPRLRAQGVEAITPGRWAALTAAD